MEWWTCPQCGSESLQTERRCTVCRHPNFPKCVVLLSIATGRQAEFTEPIRLGQAVFQHRLAEPDAAYASEFQFEVIRDDAFVAWCIRPLPGTVNPTYYNGEPIALDGTPLQDGGIISIGRTKLLLRVRFKKS